MPEIWGTTQVLAVLGWPVAHSFSPPMQNAALAALGLDYVYIPLAVPPGRLATVFAGLKAAGVVGFNATIPHKQALVALVDELTDEARLTGTVNTVHFSGDRALGDSTDGPGFVRAAAELGCAVAGRRVVLLGAGGSARAVACALARAGAARLVVANRTPDRAGELADLLSERTPLRAVEVAALESVALAGELATADLIVNTTSVGMHPDADSQPVCLPSLQEGAWLIDIIYNPLETRLMREAAARGARVAGGVEMLVGQGALSLERWTGRAAPLGVMRDVLTAELRRRAAGS